MPTTYDPRDPSTYRYLPQMERDRVERQRAFKREMEGTFQQNTDLNRELKGTFEQNQKALTGMERLRQQGVLENTALQNQGQMDVRRLMETGESSRNAATNETMRRGQDLTFQHGQDELFQRGLLEGMRDETTRRGQDLQADVAGYHYVPVDAYGTDPVTGQTIKTGQSVQIFRNGQPMVGGQHAGPQSALPPFDPGKLKPGQTLHDWFTGQSPEAQKDFLGKMALAGRDDILADFKTRRDAMNASGASPAAANASQGARYFGVSQNRGWDQSGTSLPPRRTISTISPTEARDASMAEQQAIGLVSRFGTIPYQVNPRDLYSESGRFVRKPVPAQPGLYSGNSWDRIRERLR